MATKKTQCAGCGIVLTEARVPERDEATQLLVDLGRTFSRLSATGQLCSACTAEVLWIGAALLDAKHGVAALAVERLEDLGLTRGSAWRHAHGDPTPEDGLPFPPLDQAA